MRKKSYKNLVISLLIIISLFANASAVLAAKPKKQKGKKNDEKVKVAEKKAETVKEARTEIKYTGFEAKRNPFAPPKEVAKMIAEPYTIDGLKKIEIVKMPKVEVQGIIWSKSMPQVIINGDVMKVGDYIQDFQIKEVTRKGIILFHKGEEYLMKIQSYQQNKKKPKNKRKR
ncbi:MAG: hypothetical protein KAS13_01250 [Candidatus Omnitrophica bacterium]|nr:hypothetical protein [Candidatus Omnitrophota bacterium]